MPIRDELVHDPADGRHDRLRGRRLRRLDAEARRGQLPSRKINDGGLHAGSTDVDADAAGLAEATFGAAKGVLGTVLLLTIGTGIGSALFIDGHLLDSTEFGHVTYRGKDAETLVSGAARERRGIGWKTWGREFSEYMALLERWFWPDLIILGGGVSKEYAKYARYLSARAPIVTAQYLNTSGIVGAALAGAGVGIAAAVIAREGAPAPAAAGPDAGSGARAQAAQVAASLVIEDQPPR